MSFKMIRLKYIIGSFYDTIIVIIWLKGKKYGRRYYKMDMAT